MNKTLLITLIIVVILIVVLLGIYIYYGGFEKLEFKTQEVPQETVVYKELTGNYSQTPDATDEIYYWLLDSMNLPTTCGFGIFYDNPKTVEESKLRSEVGCILDNPIDSVQMAAIQAKYKVKTIPAKKCLVTEFPFKGTLSVLVSMMKVYPAIQQYCTQNNISMEKPMMEVYDMKNMKSYYRMDLE